MTAKKSAADGSDAELEAGVLLQSYCSFRWEGEVEGVGGVGM